MINYIKRKYKNFFSCKYRKVCKHYDKDGITCGSYNAERRYCGEYRRLELKEATKSEDIGATTN